jgi:hypothetical protein
MDEEVRNHGEPSRAALVLRALERERRRIAAMRDAQILAASNDVDDMDTLANYAATTFGDID